MNSQRAADMSGPGPGSEDFLLGFGPEAIFSFNQTRFDFSLKSKYSGAKVLQDTWNYPEKISR